MGVVNVTPDSFSDGGRFFQPGAAVDHALSLIDQGADLLDIGGESTRPYSEPVGADEEWRRVGPVLEALAGRTSIPISIDTSKAGVARKALAAGVEIINDVTGLTGDPAMVDLVVESGAAVCVMHMLGTPQTMQDDPTYDDVVGEIDAFLGERREGLVLAGVHAEKICLDPGVGFGKTHQNNLTLLANCWRLHHWNCPLLVGPSRKGFIAKMAGDDETARDAGTIGVAIALARQGVQILRVHAVGQVRSALALYAAVEAAVDVAGA
jgi:dihydropteroate synthase